MLAGPAAAALPVPAPQGDDVGYLSFGAVAELTSLIWYRSALRVRGFSAGERRRLSAAATAKRSHIGRINAALGADARRRATSPRTSRRRRSPRATARSRSGREIEDLLVGVYLNGARFARDSATRLMIGRLLAYDAQQLAWLRGLTGGLAGAGLAEPGDARAGRRPARPSRHHPQLHQLLKGPAPVRIRAALPLAAVLVLAAPAAAQAFTVYGAASLSSAFPQIDNSPRYNFAGSNQLQLQIERGAPADLFASASPAEPQALFREGKCSRPVTFATNILVVVTPRDNPAGLRSVYGLRSGRHRLAVGTAGVPIGAYTRQLLRRMQLSSILTRTRSASSRTSTASSRRSASARPTPASPTSATGRRPRRG